MVHAKQRLWRQTSLLLLFLLVLGYQTFKQLLILVALKELFLGFVALDDVLVHVIVRVVAEVLSVCLLTVSFELPTPHCLFL